MKKARFGRAYSVATKPSQFIMRAKKMLHYSTMKRLLPAASYFAILLLSFVLPLPNANGRMLLPSICAFKNLTGHPCPGCGLTRSFVCLGHGHFAESFLYHPLGPVLFLGISAALVLALIRIKRPHFLTQRRLDIPALVIVGVALLLLWPLRLNGWPTPLPE